MCTFVYSKHIWKLGLWDVIQMTTGQVFKNNIITDNCKYTRTSKVIHAQLELELLIVAERIIPT